MRQAILRLSGRRGCPPRVEEEGDAKRQGHVERGMRFGNAHAHCRRYGDVRGARAQYRNPRGSAGAQAEPVAIHGKSDGGADQQPLADASWLNSWRDALAWQVERGSVRKLRMVQQSKRNRSWIALLAAGGISERHAAPLALLAALAMST